MGACLVGRNYPGKTQAQAQKLWDKDCEQSRYEDGHSYSGAIGMLNSGRVTSHVFNSIEDFEEFLGDKPKDQAYWAQVKIIRVTKPLLAAREKINSISKEIWRARAPSCPPRTLKALLARRDKAIAKAKAIESAQAAKSTKTMWCVGGLASE